MAEQRSSTAVATFLGVLFVAALAAVFLPRLFGVSSSPETEFISQLKASEKDGLTVPVGRFGEARSTRHQYARISVNLARDARSAVVVATLDFEGRLGETKVSSLGAERIPFAVKDGAWVAPEGLAPRLGEVLSALQRRRRAIEAGDRAALLELLYSPADARQQLPAVEHVLALKDRRYTASAWYIRSERDEVTVTEDFRLQGTTPDRPIDERGSKRLTLQRRGQEFLFVSGIM